MIFTLFHDRFFVFVFRNKFKDHIESIISKGVFIHSFILIENEKRERKEKRKRIKNKLEKCNVITISNKQCFFNATCLANFPP